MDSPRSTLFSCLFLCALLLSSPLAVIASPLVIGQSSILSSRIADALSVEKRDVVRPKITSPTSSSVWPVGSSQTVTWDTSDFPPVNQITNILGKVILGRDSGDSLNLQIDHPLAQGFNITDGKVSIVVPNVPPRDDYLIVLMGDSGNTSPSFAITAISAGSGSSIAGSSSSSSTSLATSRSSTAAPTTTPLPIESSTTITDPIPITGSTITGGQPGADTTFPTFSDTTTSSASSATGTTEPQQVLDNSARGRIGERWMGFLGVVAASVLML